MLREDGYNVLNFENEKENPGYDYPDFVYPYVLEITVYGIKCGVVQVIIDNIRCAVHTLATDDIYKIYAESFPENNHLIQIVEEAQGLVDTTLN